MQSEIWRNLPQHVLEIIVGKLDVESLVKFRCVSKTFKNFVSSASFRSLRLETQETSPWLVMFNKQDQYRFCRAYDTVNKKWHLISVEFLPYNRRHNLQLLAASSQLLCFTTQSCVILCNPLTQKWRRLVSSCINLLTHEMHRANRPAIAMATLSADDDVLFMLCNGRAIIYSTRSDRWVAQTESVPRSNLRSDAVFCNGSFYFISWEAEEILAYDLERSEWKILDGPMGEEALAFGRLVSCGKSVFVVGGIGFEGIAKSLCIWELHESSMEWKEVDCAPQMMSSALFSGCYHNYEHIYCFGHGDSICMSCVSWPEVLIYSLSWRTWNWVPPCPVLSNMARSGFRWVSFKPTFNGLV
ncbi:hypothetical protein SUGI_0659720 [Cryptomeria japonica]|nr:hypothetical protein SUGI_0659720 [Cryptomeria japonica]